MWEMMSTVVDVAWGVDPSQTAIPSLGELAVEKMKKQRKRKRVMPPRGERLRHT